MKKKMLMFVVISLMLVSIFAPMVSATDGVLEKILPAKVVDILTGLFVNSTGDIDDPSFVLTMRVLFMLMLFALLFGIAKIAPGLSTFPNNIRFTITLLLSIISVLFMPSSVFVAVATTYGVVFFTILLGAPVVGGAYLIFSVLKDSTRENYIAKFLIAGVLWYITGTFAKLVLEIKTTTLKSLGLFVSTTKTTTSYSLDVFGSVGQIVSFAFGVLALYYAWKSVFPGEEETEVPEEAKKAMRAVARWWKTKSVGNLLDKAPRIIDRIDAAVTANNLADVKRGISEADKIVKAVGELIGRAQAGVNDVDGAAKAPLQALITQMETAREALATQLGGVLNHSKGGAAGAAADWTTAGGEVSAARTQLNILRSRAVTFANLI